MTLSEQINQLFLEAIGEFNKATDAGQRLNASTGLVLIGERSPLDSLGFVDLTVSLVEGVEREFNVAFDLSDVLEAVESVGQEQPCTVGALSSEIAKRLGGSASIL